jgi:PmbA protein
VIPPGDRARRILEASALRSGEEVEIFALETLDRRYELGRGRLEQTESRHASGVAVRMLEAGRMGFAYRADPRLEAGAEALDEARALVALSAPDPARVLAAPQAPAVVSAPALLDLARVPVADKLALAERLGTAALAADPRVQAVPQASYQETERRCALATSAGTFHAWTRQAFALGVAALAADQGDSQLAEEYRMWRAWPDLDPEGVGRAAGERAARLLGAQAVPTGRRAVVLPPDVATGLLEAALPAWSAEAVQRRRSFLAGGEGRSLAAPGVTLVDDGLAAGGLCTAPVDDEGTPMQRTELITAGRLAGYLHTQETARRAGVRPTGNAVRPALAVPPTPGASNVSLLPGALPPEGLWARAEGGLLLAELLGLHTLNPVTGEFSLGAAGWLLAGGAPARPVRSVTIAGDLGSLLRRIAAVGNDPRTYGRFTSPSLLIDDMMVAGT